MERIINENLTNHTLKVGYAELMLNKGIYFCGRMVSLNENVIFIDKDFSYCSDKFGKSEIDVPTDNSYIKIKEDNTRVSIKVGSGTKIFYDYNSTPLFEPFVYDNLFLNDPYILKYASFESITISEKIFRGKLDLLDFRGRFFIGRDFPIKGDIDDIPEEYLSNISMIKNITGGDLSKLKELKIVNGTCQYLNSVDRSSNTDLRSLYLTITNDGGLDKLLIDLASISSWRSNVVLNLWGKKTEISDSAVQTIKSSASNLTFKINGVVVE